MSPFILIIISLLRAPHRIGRNCKHFRFAFALTNDQRSCDYQNTLINGHRSKATSSRCPWIWIFWLENEMSNKQSESGLEYGRVGVDNRGIEVDIRPNQTKCEIKNIAANASKFIKYIYSRLIRPQNRLFHMLLKAYIIERMNENPLASEHFLFVVVVLFLLWPFCTNTRYRYTAYLSFR